MRYFMSVLGINIMMINVVLFMNEFLEPRMKCSWKQLVLYPLVYAFAADVFCAISITLYMQYQIFSNIIWYCIATMLLYRTKVWKAMVSVICFLLTGGLSEIVIVLVWNITGLSYDMYTGGYIMAFVYQCIAFVIIFIAVSLVRIIHRLTTYNVSRIVWTVIGACVAVLAASAVYIYMIYGKIPELGQARFINDHVDSILTIIVAAALLMCVVMIFAIAQNAMRSVQRAHALEMDRLNAELAFSRTQSIERNERELEEIRTDMHNRLDNIVGLFNEGRQSECHERISTLISDINATKILSSCGNRLMDGIFAIKLAKMKSSGIENEWMLDNIPEKLNADDLAVCAIFGNLFDNAIEGSERMPDGQRRIRVRVTAQGPSVVVSIANRCSDAAALVQSATKVSSKRKSAPGLGMQSIQASAKQCGYTVTTAADADNEWFISTVIMPREENIPVIVAG